MADLLKAIRANLIERGIPELPPVGKTLTGICKKPHGIITVRESLKHPGYLDVCLTNGTEAIYTARPVRRGEFARQYLAQMISEEMPGATDLHWKTKDTPPPRPPKEELSQVYFIYATDAEKVKIGYSDSPESRLKTLQIGSPVPLHILVTVKGGANLEKKLHEKFSRSHSHGEWFHMSEDIEMYIREVRRDRWVLG